MCLKVEKDATEPYEKQWSRSTYLNMKLVENKINWLLNRIYQSLVRLQAEASLN